MGNNPFGPPPGGYGPPAGGYGPPPGGGQYGGPQGYAQPGNPYAPPQAYASVIGPGGALPGGRMKVLYLVGWAGVFVFAGLGGVLSGVVSGAGGGDDASAIVAIVAFSLAGLSAIGAMVGHFIWLYQAWSTVPPEMRYTNGGTWVSPGKAVGYLFIPFFNLYWLFIANVGLCSAINRTLQSRGQNPSAPGGLATAACVTQLIPYCGALVAPILLCIYMFQADTARRQMLGI
jgi:hypothetical protein